MFELYDMQGWSKGLRLKGGQFKTEQAGFSLGCLHMGGGGGFVAPHMGGTSAGGQSVNGGDS